MVNQGGRENEKSMKRKITGLKCEGRKPGVSVDADVRDPD